MVEDSGHHDGLDPVDQVQEELRVYAVLRDDLPLPPIEYITLAAKGYLELAGMVGDNPTLSEGYDLQQQPKLVKRAKNENRMEKAAEALQVAGIPHIRVSVDGTLAGLFLPPMPRSALPTAVDSLQLFENPRKVYTTHKQAYLVTSREGTEDTFASIVVDGSLEAPLGKMMAQAGHGVWTAVAAGGMPGHLKVAFPSQRHEFADTSYRISMDKSGDGASGVIVDMGRTVFSGETATCAWSRSDLIPHAVSGDLQLACVRVLGPAAPMAMP